MVNYVKNDKELLMQGDCLELMRIIPDNFIDCIICDLPYGMTCNAWDKPLNFELLWENYNRIIKPNGAILLFGIEPFSSKLRLSNINNYKYDIIWRKSRATGHLNAWKQPMRNTENISVFYSEQCTYNPQLTDKLAKNIRSYSFRTNSSNYGEMEGNVRKCPNDKQMPATIIEFDNPRIIGGHPTQKPIPLIEYLIKTYTNENELVLDNCIGSGTTAIAARNLNRRWIGIEKDEQFYNKAKERIWTDTK